MKLFEYKPTEYVDVHPDLPLEWMQQEIDKTQNKYDAKLGAVNELNKQFADMKAGAQTQEELKTINDEYSKRINDMVSGLTTTGYIPQTSADLAKFISEVSFDPRVKQIKDDREAYEIHQKNLLDPQYAGGVDMLQYRKPGTPYDPSHYKIIPASDSVAKSRTVAQTMHPSTIDGGKTWTVTDPFTGQTVTRNSYSDAVGVSKERIAAYTDANYVNWKTDPDSYADRVQLSGNDMSFWDKPEGKALYDQKMKALEPLAYQTDTTPKTAAPAAKPVKPAGEETDGLPKTINKSQTYGYTEGLGINYEGNFMNNYTEVDKQSRYHNDQISALENNYNNLVRSGLKDSDPRVKEAAKKLRDVVDESVIHEDRRRAIEGKNYDKDWSVDVEKAKEENSLIQKYNDMANSIKEHPKQHLFFNDESIEKAVSEYKELAQKELYKTLKEMNSPAGDVLKAYEEYADFQTTGRSYVVPEESKYLVGDLVKSLLNDNVSAKNIISDLPMDAEKQKKLFASLYNKETGEYDFKRLSPSINLDDKDGPVLILSGLLDGDEHVSLEYKLEDTPNIREVLYNIAPEEEHQKLNYYVNATESLKKTGGRKGEFSVDRYDGTKDNFEFTKVALGKGKWGYKDSKGVVHGSISDLIDGNMASITSMDIIMKRLNEELQISQNPKTGNPEKAAELHKKLTNLVHADRIERELHPITGKPMTTADREKYITRKEPVEKPEAVPTTTSALGKQQPQTQSNSLGW
jgi:ASC-1-like (ASCH) protein